MRPASSRRVESHTCAERAIFAGRGPERESDKQRNLTKSLEKRPRERTKRGKKKPLSPEGERGKGTPGQRSGTSAVEREKDRGKTGSRARAERGQAGHQEQRQVQTKDEKRRQEDTPTRESGQGEEQEAEARAEARGPPLQREEGTRGDPRKSTAVKACQQGKNKEEPETSTERQDAEKSGAKKGSRM